MFEHSKVKYAAVMFMGFVILGCTSTKKTNESTTSKVLNQNTLGEHSSNDQRNKTGIPDFSLDDHEDIKLRPDLKPPTVPKAKQLLKDNIQNSRAQIDTKALIRRAAMEVRANSSPVAQKIVENYLASNNREPGGHCLTVSKGRFEKAYKEVHGKLPYQDLPKDMASKYHNARQVFNLLYVSASEKHQRWRSLPKKYRGKGNAGAIAYAGMGKLVGTSQIWKGKLQPGALVQVWRYEDDYDDVVRGTDVKKLDPYGHSFIFIDYVRDENHNITGLKIADQGFQSYRPLRPRDYEVWWGVNLTV